MVDAESRASKQKERKKGDLKINFKLTSELKKLIGDEVFLLSAPVVRYNKYGWRNSRLLLLT